MSKKSCCSSSPVVIAAAVIDSSPASPQGWSPIADLAPAHFVLLRDESGVEHRGFMMHEKPHDCRGLVMEGFTPVEFSVIPVGGL